jgi:hypothetical protein
MYKFFLLFVAVLVMVSTGLMAENLIEGGSFEAEDEDAWQIYWYNADEQPEYEFGYTEEIPSMGKGACLHIWTEETSSAQLLLWQPVTLTAGTTYEVSAAIKCLFFETTSTSTSEGPWFQLYIHPEEPQDPASATDYNPTGGKFFDITAWVAECEFADLMLDLDGYWQDFTCGETMESAPLFTPEGDAGADVELIFGIKFGHYWGSGTASFDIVVDEVILALEGHTGSPGIAMELMPKTYVLHQNFPNPFNPTTQIGYVLPKSEMATLTVYDMLGKEVQTLVNEHKSAGSYTVSFDAGNLASGIYFYKLQTPGYSEIKKMVIMR